MLRVVGQGVYFLFKGEELVYIGKAKSIYSRIGQHVVSSKDFDSWDYYECRPESYSPTTVELLEAHLIEWFKPRYNVAHAQGHDESPTAVSKEEYARMIRGVIRDWEIEMKIRPRDATCFCKDCKWYGFAEEGHGRNRHAVCPMRRLPDPYGHCYKAERKEA